jgi:hypothetical protein
MPLLTRFRIKTSGAGSDGRMVVLSSAALRMTRARAPDTDEAGSPEQTRVRVFNAD